MEPEQVPTPVPPTPVQPVEPQPEASDQHAFAHTYQDDLAQAMGATDPSSVQKMLADARDEEVEAKAVKREHAERKWYSTSGILLLLLTLGVLAYGAYYYMHLTVPVTPAMSVGVFQHTDSIVASTTSVPQVLATYTATTVLPVGKPTLINLVTDAQTGTLLSNTQLYSFIGATVPKPLQSVITVARWGVVNTGTETVPFIIASVTDPEKAANEFTVAEPVLPELFASALGIQQQPSPSFQSQYFYNIPVRSSANFFYGSISNNLVVITSQPAAIKAVYDTVISQ